MGKKTSNPENTQTLTQSSQRKTPQRTPEHQQNAKIQTNRHKWLAQNNAQTNQKPRPKNQQKQQKEHQ